MTDSISHDELLARHIISSKWYRKRDQTVKQDAFIPPEDPLELSTTRHLNFSEDEIWDTGRKVAAVQSRNLHGRADLKVSNVALQLLSVMPDPTPDNPNHANIIGWPQEKDARKSIALELAKNARFIATPQSI